MTKMSASQSKNQEPSKPTVKATETNEIVFKKKHEVIYNIFIQSLKDKAQKNNEIALALMLSQSETVFKDVNPKDIKPLSEENFSQFLLLVFKKIREKRLANEENLKNGKIKEVVDECVADIRGTEAKDSLIKLIGLPLGVKIDPKNALGSIKDGLLEKVPFLGKGKKEEDEPPLSDEEMVTKFLRKIFLPVLLSAIPMLIFGPTTFGVVLVAIGAVIAIKRGVEVLFSNNKPGTLYDPSSQDKDDTEKMAKLNKKILDGIDDILKTPVKEIPEQISQGSKKQPTPEQAPQVGNKGGEQLTMLGGKITIDQPAKSTEQTPVK